MESVLLDKILWQEGGPPASAHLFRLVEASDSRPAMARQHWWLPDVRKEKVRKAATTRKWGILDKRREYNTMGEAKESDRWIRLQRGILEGENGGKV